MDVIKIAAWAALRECRYWRVRVLQEVALALSKINRFATDKAINATIKFRFMYGAKRDEAQR